MSYLRCLNRLSLDRRAVLVSKPIIESHSMRLNKELRQQDTKALSRRTFSRPSAWHRYLEHRKRSKRSEIYSEEAHWFLKRLLKSLRRRKLKRRILLIQLYWIRTTPWRMKTIIIKWWLVTLSIIQLKVASKLSRDNTTIVKWISMNPLLVILLHKALTKKALMKIFSISWKVGKVVETCQLLKNSTNKQLERIIRDTLSKWSCQSICDLEAIAHWAIIIPLCKTTQNKGMLQLDWKTAVPFLTLFSYLWSSVRQNLSSRKVHNRCLKAQAFPSCTALIQGKISSIKT